MKKILSLLVFVVMGLSMYAEQDSLTNKKLVYRLNIRREIGPAIWRQTKQAFAEARSMDVDYFVINMNTYGGAVVQADSIRTKILNSDIPVFVFIDNNAASAGALISIACDKIYMRKGGSIGAATVVNQTGQAMPDKYQSYMRSIMRATAEAHGKDTLINGKDTIYKWRRNPLIAEAMVDQRLAVKGLIDTSKVLTFTPEEAMEYSYCDGIAETINEMLHKENINNYEIAEYRASSIENIIGFLVNPIVQGVLIMLIIGGIYFELQTPGIGFPIAASIFAAIIYFSPLYLEGLAENYEIIIFVIGVILLAIEIFVIPGFGVAGILGIIGIVTGLSLSMVDNYGFTFELHHIEKIFRALGIVSISAIASIIFSIMITKRVLGNRKWAFALHTEEKLEDGYVGVDATIVEKVGKIGESQTVLRPSGKVIIDGDLFDAISVHGDYIPKGTRVRVIKFIAGQIYVEEID